jgi:ADP-ribose pyrophosphatase YjhB (NUDIX family)
MTYPQNEIDYKGIRVLNTWIRTNDVEQYQPITQVYGIIFNSKREILICREKEDGEWQIPGGHPEKGENVVQTLERELLEEVDVTIKDIIPLGTQEVSFPDNPEKPTIYQVRCIASLDKLLPQTPDPANGNVWERKFVPAEKVTNYVKWRVSGDAMFEDAIRLRKRNNFEH